ncbi:hypothetical protein CXG81DRAFT_9657 [Caulochytrium protostelioides]|uniref:EamA domain-containing protein n=1 Tax=Caulochytrium protostelioides TaxID=1555241 RepID=A0A4P9XD05_9FUNG|nr:hypothetical protein CXG81DRAFT_9657 [Caulochytrium protostelioides]|eukprot:RKP03354.1 hypothetical protein CXG81DRAFT_9657 [Caulochytrium protostelioides]
MGHRGPSWLPKRLQGSLTLFFLCMTIVSSVCMSETTQYLQRTYSKPMMISCLIHSFFSLILLVMYVGHYHKGPSRDYPALLRRWQSMVTGITIPGFWGVFRRYAMPSVCFTLSSLTWYSAVNKAPMADLTVIFNTSCFFCYVLSVLWLGEKAEPIKLGGVCLAVFGTLVMTLWPTAVTDDSELASDSWIRMFGYLSVTASSLTMATYECMVAKIYVRPSPPMLLSITFTGIIGLWTMFFTPFILLISHVSGIETLVLPNASQFGWICIISLFGVAYNCAFMLLIAYSSPMLASVGLLLTIPCTTLADTLLFGNNLGWNFAVGTLFIVAGWICLNFWSRPADETLPVAVATSPTAANASRPSR